MTVAQLEKDLKDGNLASIYCIYGKETFLLENAIKKIKKLFGNLVDGLNYIKIENSNIDSLIQELQTPAFGFEKKLIVVKDVEILKKQGKKKNQQINEKAEEIANYINDNLKNIIEQNVIIFIEDEIEKNNLYKLLEKIRSCL